METKKRAARGGASLCLVCATFLAEAARGGRSLRPLDDAAGDGAAGGGQKAAPPLALACLYAYGLPLRPWILRAKVAGDRCAVGLLGELMRERYRQEKALARWAEVFVVAPSSLWSRANGRLDLAYALATSLTVDRAQIVPAPWSLDWRWRKRALVETSARDVAPPPSPRRWHELLDGAWLSRHGVRLKGRRLLLIDDVATTGFTLRQLAGRLGRAQPDEMRALTLAGAPALR